MTLSDVEINVKFVKIDIFLNILRHVLHIQSSTYEPLIYTYFFEGGKSSEIYLNFAHLLLSMMADPQYCC